VWFRLPLGFQRVDNSIFEIGRGVLYQTRNEECRMMNDEFLNHEGLTSHVGSLEHKGFLEAFFGFTTERFHLHNQKTLGHSSQCSLISSR
jgi:hypothetical protein